MWGFERYELLQFKVYFVIRYNSKDSDHSDGTQSGVGTPV